MACSEFEDLILDYFDDALSTEQRSRLDAHVAACAECRRFWSVQKALDIELPAGFRQRVLSCLQTEVETTRFVYLPEVLDVMGWLSVAAAAGWYGLHYLPV